jgi:hypothetical protein
MMATVNFIKYQRQSAGALSRVSAYVKQEQKTEGQRLVSGINCSPQFSVQEFLATRQMHRKESPVYFYHYTQAFHPEENITGAAAHKLAKEFAEKAWPGCEVLVATHTDADHIHSHFIVNAVRPNDGKMLRQGPATLQHLRTLSDELCVQYGYSVLPTQRQKKTDGLSTREYRSAVKGQSWKFRLMNTIENCMRYAGSREDFIRLMESEGYQVKWIKDRKNITYTTPQGRKCRDDRLHGDKFWKEVMEREFRIREEIFHGRIDGEEQAYRIAQSRESSHRERVGADDGITAPDRKATGTVGKTDGRIPGAAQPAWSERTPDSDGGGTASPTSDGGEDGTGWEKERAAYFVSQGLTTPAQSGVALGHPDLTGLVGDLVQWGRHMEQSADAPLPSVPVSGHIDRKRWEELQRKRIASGHKPDDHEEQSQGQQMG